MSVIQSPQAPSELLTPYICFQIGEGHFSFPMSFVREIVLMPEVINVPLSPPALLGLANLRGVVLPVIDLAKMLDMDQAEDHRTTVVIVHWNDSLVGLRIGEVNRMIRLSEATPCENPEMASKLPSEVSQGVIRDNKTGLLIHLLDIVHLIPEELYIPPVQRNKHFDFGNVQRASKSPKEPKNDGLHLVCLQLAEQEFGLPVEHVQEIVRSPGTIASLPNAMDHVLGLVTLRGQLLPLISLRKLFGMPEMDQIDWILVLKVDDGKGDPRMVGMVVDRVQEILRIPRESQNTISKLMAQHRDMREIDAICRLDEGRLINVLKARALCYHPSIEAVRPPLSDQSPGSRTMFTRSQRHAANPASEIDFVVFALGPQQFAVSVEHVQEILKVPKDMSLMPNTPDFVDGLINLHGSVLPILDLRTRLGMPRLDTNGRQRILVLVVDNVRLGFVVDAVSEVVRFGSDLIEEAPAITEAQRRIMGRIINAQDRENMIVLINAPELFSTSEAIETITA